MRVVSSILLLLLLAASSNGQQGSLGDSPHEDATSVGSAIVDAIDKFYIQGFRRYEVRIYGEITPHLNDVIATVGREIDGSSTFNIKHFPMVNEYNCMFVHSAVILTSKTETLNAINALSSFAVAVERSQRFIVHCEHWNESVLKLPVFNVHYLHAGHVTQHEYIVVKSNNSINMLTLRSYTEKACDTVQLVELDTFNGTSRKWPKRVDEIENGRQFYGCMIVAHFNLDTPGSYVYESDTVYMVSNPTETLDYDTKVMGVYPELHEALAKIGNFTPHYQIIFDHIFRHTIRYDNYIEYEMRPLNVNNSVYCFWMRKFFFIVTPNALYTNYEKLFFAFDTLSWILFGVSFGVIFLTIALINRQPKEMQQVVYGSAMRNPAYNALGAFFGISQLRLPIENCPRILIIFFLYYCLIIRTCWQGRMFDFMTTDMRKPEPNTVDEMWEQNYTIVYPEPNLIRGLSESQHKRFMDANKIIVIEDLDEWLDLLMNDTLGLSGSARLAILFVSEWSGYLEKRDDTMLGSKMLFPDDNYAAMITIGLPVNCILYDLVLNATEKLTTMGIIQHLYDFEVQYKYPQDDMNYKDNRRILSVRDLEYGFVLWLIAGAISIAVFLIEISPKIKEHVRNVIGLLFVVYGLHVRMDKYHS